MLGDIAGRFGCGRGTELEPSRGDRRGDRAGQNESAPETGTLPNLTVRASSSDFGRLDLQKLARARDRDRPRLHRLWDLAYDVDVQEPILQARTPDLHMVGELEATFEVPRGDALVQYVATLLLR